MEEDYFNIDLWKDTEYFTYDDFFIEENTVTYIFSFSDLTKYQTQLDFDYLPQDTIKQKEIETTLFHIGMSLLPWFLYGILLQKIVIRAGFLDSNQIAFWEDFYKHSMSEFWFLNNLNFNEFISIQVEALPSKNSTLLKRSLDLTPKVLVPLGAGKDSLVWEILQNCNVLTYHFFMEQFEREYQQSRRYAALIRESLKNNHFNSQSFSQLIERFQSAQYKCNIRAKEDVFIVTHRFNTLQNWENKKKRSIETIGGPWSLLVALSAVINCILFDLNYIAVGNERSANYGNNLFIHGMEVNHQYDKCFEFEKKLNQYIKQYLVEDLHYFSTLQHLWEVQIAQQFCNMEKYLQLFISCNLVCFGDNPSRWCAECSKCAFVFILLSAFLPPRKVWSIFGDNLFERKKLLNTYDELLGLKKEKPFECVGTPEEVILSLYLAKTQYEKYENYLPFLLQERGTLVEQGKHYLHLLMDFNKENLFPHWMNVHLYKLKK